VSDKTARITCFERGKQVNAWWSGDAASAGARLKTCGLSKFLNLKPYTLHSTPSTLNPTPYILHPALYSLIRNPKSYTIHPSSYTLHPTTYNLHPTPYTLTPHPAPQQGFSSPTACASTQQLTLPPSPPLVSTPSPSNLNQKSFPENVVNCWR
jgi:hypothetical protein